MTYESFDADAVMLEFQDPEVVCEIIGLLRADIPRYLNEYQAARAAGQPGVAQRAAHTIKGAASNVCAREVCDVAKAIETSLRGGGDDAPALEPRLHAACERLTRDLAAWEAALKAATPDAR